MKKRLTWGVSPSASSEAEGGELQLRGLGKVYPNGTVAVSDVNLSVAPGEFVSLLGSSGSGKTTTLRMVGGFETPTDGDVLLGGRSLRDVGAHRRPINTVCQDYALFPHLDVRRNVEFGLRAHKVSSAETRRRVDEVLEKVQLGALGDRSPGELSGGQRQRVALARALVLQPKVLLLDEPLGALDLKLRRQMQVVLVELCRDFGITFLYVTHDQEEALAMSDRVAVMRDGRLEQCGSPQELYEQPVSLPVADFVGENNLLDGRLVERLVDGAAVVEIEGKRIVADARSLNGAAPGDGVVLAVRPESFDVTSGSTGEGISGTVVQTVYGGSRWRVVIRTSSDTVLSVDLPSDRARELELGAAVQASPRAGEAIVFDRTQSLTP